MQLTIRIQITTISHIHKMKHVRKIKHLLSALWLLFQFYIQKLVWNIYQNIIFIWRYS